MEEGDKMSILVLCYILGVGWVKVIIQVKSKNTEAHFSLFSHPKFGESDL